MTREEYISELESYSNEELFGQEEWKELRAHEIEELTIVKAKTYERELHELDDEDLFGEDYLDRLRHERICDMVRLWEQVQK